MSGRTENPMPVAVLTPGTHDIDPVRETLIKEVAGIYPYVPGKYGIDFNSLIHQAVDFRERPIECFGGSGKKIYVEIGKLSLIGILYDAVTIRREEKEKPGERVLEAGLILSEENTLQLKLRTRSRFLKRRDPDFFAGKFVEFIINYFERIRGNEVKRVRGIWETWSDNYSDFFRVYNKEGRDRAYQQKGQHVLLNAARNAWTARILAGLGFDQIEDVQLVQDSSKYISLRGYQIYSYVEAVFSRKQDEYKLQSNE